MRAFDERRSLPVSALARNSNQVLPMVVVTLMVQLVLAGGFIPVTDRVLDPVSWLTPARWGLAATASTADLRHTVAVIPQDSHWKHTASAWSVDMVMLGVLSVLYVGFARWKIRLRASSRALLVLTLRGRNPIGLLDRIDRADR